MDFNTLKTDMEFLGTYKKEFDDTIRMDVDVLNQYEKAYKEYEKGGCKPTVECGNGSVKKNPILNVLESLRKEHIVLSDRLGTTPKALDQIKNAQIPQEKTALEQFLSDFNARNETVRQSDD